MHSPAPVTTTLAVTERSGIAAFTFPSGHARRTSLFKVADSANPVCAASVDSGRPRRDRGTGHERTVLSGPGPNYTLHFVALFEDDFRSAGTFGNAGTAPGSTTCTGTTCGAYVTFDPRPPRRTVLMKVGISFVSTADAAQNLQDEDPGWSVQHVATAAHDAWNAVLGRIAVGGGTADRTAHLLHRPLPLAPLPQRRLRRERRLRRHRRQGPHRPRHAQEYANFSEWDIYRSEIQLESLLDPHAVGDMVQSLVDSAEQDGWLPKWQIVGGDESQINGDSADPIIADAYAMGVRNFDVQAALTYMVKGATQDETNHGLEIERQYLSQYLSQHYVNAGSLDLTSIDYSIGGSATLEYAIDDFAISRLADAEHDTTLAATMRRRAANWEYLFNPATGYIQARGPDGSFPPGQAFETSQLEPGGQTGFEEGNAIQYTWDVPQDLAGLAGADGWRPGCYRQARTFFTQLNATR